jgi:hypothetical protein
VYTRLRVCAAIAAVTAVFATTGCTVATGVIAGAGLLGGGAAPTTATPTTTTTTTAAPYLTTTPTLELNDRTTAPGAKLKFGEQAVVPFYSHYAKGLLGISVTVENVRARDSDIAHLPLKDEDKAKLRGKMFFYVHQKLVNVDGVNFAEIYAPTLEATTRSGGFPGVLLGMGNTAVTGCDGHSFAPSTFSTKGATFEQCTWFFGEDSDPIASLAYTDKPYETADTRAVTWRDY